MAQALGSKLSRCVARQPQGERDWRSEQRIAEGIQNQRKRAFGDMMRLVTHGQLGDETLDRFKDRVQRIAVAGKDHPGGEGACALLPEGVEALVDDDARVSLAGAGALNGV